MVGAMILARAVDDPALSGEVLDQTRAWLEANARGAGLPRSRTNLAKARRAARGTAAGKS